MTPMPHCLGVLPQFAHQRGKIRIARVDHEGIDMFFGVTEVERIDDHADISRVLAGLAPMRDLDQLEGRFMNRGPKSLVAISVSTRLLEDDRPINQEALKDRRYVERPIVCIRDTECDVLKIAKQGKLMVLPPILHPDAHPPRRRRTSSFTLDDGLTRAHRSAANSSKLIVVANPEGPRPHQEHLE